MATDHPPTARELLSFYLEAGVDCAIGEEPDDRGGHRLFLVGAAQLDEDPAPEALGAEGNPVTARVYDAVVVGGGHNGLTCAAYLAAAGLSVCVVERRGIVDRRVSEPDGSFRIDELVPFVEFTLGFGTQRKGYEPMTKAAEAFAAPGATLDAGTIMVKPKS